MYINKGIKIRIDDVLQTELFSSNQLESLKEKSFFEWFKWTIDQLGDIPLTLAIVAEGIDKEPEWVEYIKAHPNWKVQVHCWKHESYARCPVQYIVNELGNAIEKIEYTFQQKVTEFIPPRLNYGVNTEKACKILGLREDRNRFHPNNWIQGEKELFFHFWKKKEVERAIEIINANSSS